MAATVALEGQYSPGMDNSTVMSYLADDFEKWYGGQRWTWHETPQIGAQMAKRASKALKKPKPRRGEYLDSGLPTPPPSPISASLKPIFISELFNITTSPKGGVGAFALQDIENGTEIHSEPALLQATDTSLQQAFKELSADQKKSYLKLYSYDAIDVNKVVAVFKTNRFRTIPPNCGIFLIASRFNHACKPSCSYTWSTDRQRLILTTSQDILKGQEITISYGQTPYILYLNYGFHCDCDTCPSPVMTAANFEKRKGCEQRWGRKWGLWWDDQEWRQLGKW